MAKLSNRTFGVEFELFFLPENWEKLKKDYNSLYPITVSDKQKELLNKSNAIPYTFIENIIKSLGLTTWEVVDDISISADQDKSIECEIKTGILQGPTGLKEILTFCNTFKKYANVNTSTGIHVHVDAKDFISGNNVAEKLTLAMLHYKNSEELFDSFVMAHRKGNTSYYSRKLEPVDEIISNYKSIILANTQDLNKIVNSLQLNRKLKLNIWSLQKYGTIEFRQMHGSLNGELIKNWVIICSSFLDGIKNIEQEFTEMFSKINSQLKTNLNIANVPQNLLSRGIDYVLDSLKSIFMSYFYDRNLGKPIEAPIDFSKESLISYNKIKYNRALPKKEINGMLYYPFSLSTEQFEKYFSGGDVVENMRKIIDRQQQRNDKIKNYVLYEISPSEIIVNISPALVATVDPSFYSQLETDEEKNVSSKLNQIQPSLPQRNISKLQKQTSTRPLAEAKKKP